MNDTGIEFYTFRGPGDAKTTIGGEALEYLQDEALRRGITLDQLWAEMMGEAREAYRQLEKN